MKKRILALALTTVMALSTLVGVLVAHKMTIEPVAEETAMVIDEEPSRAVLAANYTQEDLNRVAKEAFDIINKVRKENGRSPFKWGDDTISKIRANEITEIFSHYSESGISDQIGENCARTNTLNAQHVVELWMYSAGHRAAILDYYDAGSNLSSIAVVQKDGKYYWVENFYTPKTYEKRLSEYEQTYGEIKKKEETKPQPSSAAAEVKQEEQKPATEVKQEVKQETKPEVKEEQKPVTTPEVKQDNQTPASKVEVVKEEEQKPVPSTTAETKPSNSATTNVSGDNKDNSGQKTSTNRPRPRGLGATAPKGEEIPGLTIYYDKETDQRYEIVVAPGQSREEAFREQVLSRNEANSQTPSGETPVGEMTNWGTRVLSRTTETGPNGETIIKEDSIDSEGIVYHSTYW